MPHNLASLSDEKLAEAYGDLLELLKERGIIHTNNLVGDLGEYLVTGYYNSRSDLPSLTRAPTNTTNYDATAGRMRFSIKSTSGNRTGAFHLPEVLNSRTFSVPPFDVVIVARLSKSYRLKSVHEFSWETFLAIKSWSKRQSAWFISLSRKNLNQGQLVLSEIN